MKKEEFYFDSRDGQSKIHAVRYTPEQKEVIGVVQIIHGMAEYVERYEELAEFLTDKGFVVTGDDHLGHGKSVPQGGSFGYFCEQDPATVVVRDVHRLKKMTQSLYPGVPYIILGHSMGSFILRNYLCRYGTGISGAVIVGTGMQSPAVIKLSKAVTALQKRFCGSKHVGKFIDKAAFGSYNKRFEPVRTPADWLSRNEANVDRYVADPLCGFVFTVNGFETLFELISRIQKRENLEKVPKTLPVFMVAGGDDPVGEFGEGVKRAFASLKDVGLTNIQMKLYEKDRHELLNEVDRDVVMQDIYDWIKGTILV
ncbi:MAG: alpha/beta hydrolase [Lachnospiraceae bacterium]|nr:alpha/beta hydrolase [Lachnospiraceae bacterium]